MTFGDIVYQLHDEHCLAHAGTAKQTDFAAFAVRLEQVDDFDAGIKNLSAYREVVKFGRRLMYGSQILALELRQAVDGFANHIEKTSLYLLAGGHRYRALEIVHPYAALQSVGAFHRHAAHGILADVLFNLKYKHTAVGAVYL